MKASRMYARGGLPGFLKIAFSSKEQSCFLYLELTVYFLPPLFLTGAGPWPAAPSTACRKGRACQSAKIFPLGGGPHCSHLIFGFAYFAGGETQSEEGHRSPCVLPTGTQPALCWGRPGLLAVTQGCRPVARELVWFC